VLIFRQAKGSKGHRSAKLIAKSFFTRGGRAGRPGCYLERWGVQASRLKEHLRKGSRPQT